MQINTVVLGSCLKDNWFMLLNLLSPLFGQEKNLWEK